MEEEEEEEECTRRGRAMERLVSQKDHARNWKMKVLVPPLKGKVQIRLMKLVLLYLGNRRVVAMRWRRGVAREKEE